MSDRWYASGQRWASDQGRTRTDEQVMGKKKVE
jgi:hypothetical protein